MISDWVPMPLPLGLGLDSNSNQAALPPGQMRSLVNMTFNKANALSKRYGFDTNLDTLGGAAQLFRYQGRLLAAQGGSLYDFSTNSNGTGAGKFSNRGTLRAIPCRTRQTATEASDVPVCNAAAANQFTCLAWVVANNAYVGISGGYVIKVQVIDENTGAVVYSSVAPYVSGRTPTDFSIAGAVIGGRPTFLLTWCDAAVALYGAGDSSWNWSATVTPGVSGATHSRCIAANSAFYMLSATSSTLKLAKLQVTIGGVTPTVSTISSGTVSKTVDLTYPSLALAYFTGPLGLYVSFYNGTGIVSGVFDPSTCVYSGDNNTQMANLPAHIVMATDGLNRLTVLYDDASVAANLSPIRGVDLYGGSLAGDVLFRGARLVSDAYYSGGNCYFAINYTSLLYSNPSNAVSAGNTLADGTVMTAEQVNALKLPTLNSCLMLVTLSGAIVSRVLRAATLTQPQTSALTVTPSGLVLASRSTSQADTVSIAAALSQGAASLVYLDLSLERVRTAEALKQLFTSGGAPHGYDGVVPFEQGFSIYPEIISCINPTVNPVQGRGHQVDGNTIALWRHDETSGTAVADSAGSYPLTAGTSSTIVTGEIGHARSFTGGGSASTVLAFDNGPVDDTFSSVMEADNTIEAVINPTDSGDSAHTIFAFDTGDGTAYPVALRLIRFSGSGSYLSVQAGGSAYSDPNFTLVPFGSWSHVAAVFSGTTLNFYINGALVGTVTGTSRPAAGFSPRVLLGSRAYFFDRFAGAIDEVRISNIARNAAAILQDYDNCFFGVTFNVGQAVTLVKNSGASVSDAVQAAAMASVFVCVASGAGGSDVTTDVLANDPGVGDIRVSGSASFMRAGFLSSIAFNTGDTAQLDRVYTPSTPNGLGYVLTGWATGAAPVFNVEPTWPTTTGGTVVATAADARAIYFTCIGKLPDLPVSGHAYTFASCYAFVDAQGNLHRSALSPMASITTTTEAPLLVVTQNRLTEKLNGRVEIYATNSDGTVLQLVAVQPNNTSVDALAYSYNVADATQELGAICYQGSLGAGGLPNTPPPACTSLAIWNQRVACNDTENPYRVALSQLGVSGYGVAWSDEIGVLVDGRLGTVQALAVMDTALVIFQERGISILQGDGPDNTGSGNSFSAPQAVVTDVGCTNPDSIVWTPIGLLFQSQKGLYLFGRDTSSNYVGEPVESEAPLASAVLASMQDPNARQAIFLAANNTFYIYNYQRKAWMTWVVLGMSPVSVCEWQNKLVVAFSNGAVFQQSLTSCNDPTSLGGLRLLNFSFEIGSVGFNGVQGYGRARSCKLLFNSPAGGHGISVLVRHNYADSTVQTAASQTLAAGMDRFEVRFQTQRSEAIGITVTETTANGPVDFLGVVFDVGILAGTARVSPTTKRTH